MSALLSRARDVAMSNAADAMIGMAVTGSIPATLWREVARRARAAS